MSEYGRLYEQASVIHRQLQQLLPGSLVGNYTPADAKIKAREAMSRFVSQVDRLVDEWTALEKQMRETDD